MNALNDTEQLAQLVLLKHELLSQLCELARRQLQIIAADDVDRLMSLLAEKQKLLHQLQRVERTLDPFRQQDAEARQWPSPEARRRCQVIAERANALLGELLQLEKQAEGQLVQAHAHTARELEHSTQAIAARNAYVAPVATMPRGLDLMSET